MALKSIVCILFSAVLALSQERQIVPAAPEEPVYKVLFESGYYREAIDYLNSRLSDSTDTLKNVYHRYLACSYAMIGDSGRATETFRKLLALAPEFSMDSISTPPRIMRSFRAALARTNLPAVTQTGIPAVLTPPPFSARLAPPPKGDMFHLPIYFVPGGAGQFYNREYKKGTLLFCIQGLALASSIWAYQERQKYYSPQFGWHPENFTKGESYLQYSRINFGVFCGTYIYSVIDAFLRGRKE